MSPWCLLGPGHVACCLRLPRKAAAQDLKRKVTVFTCNIKIYQIFDFFFSNFNKK